MKITRNQLRRLILKEFKISPDYTDYFTGFNIDTIVNPEEQEFNQKEVWGVRLQEMGGANLFNIYLILYSENQMIEFVNLYRQRPGLVNYLNYLSNEGNMSDEQLKNAFIACKGVHDPKIKAKICDEDTDSILIHDHSIADMEAIDVSHGLFYNPVGTDTTFNCR